MGNACLGDRDHYKVPEDKEGPARPSVNFDYVMEHDLTELSYLREVKKKQ